MRKTQRKSYPCPIRVAHIGPAHYSRENSAKSVNLKLLALLENGCQWPSERLHHFPSIPELLEMQSVIGKQPLVSIKSSSKTSDKSSHRSVGRQFESLKLVNFNLLALVENGSQSPSQLCGMVGNEERHWERTVGFLKNDSGSIFFTSKNESISLKT